MKIFETIYISSQISPDQQECEKSIIRSPNHEMYLKRVLKSTPSPSDEKRCYINNIKRKFFPLVSLSSLSLAPKRENSTVNISLSIPHSHCQKMAADFLGYKPVKEMNHFSSTQRCRPPLLPNTSSLTAVYWVKLFIFFFQFYAIEPP